VFATGSADRTIKLWDLAKASVGASDAMVQPTFQNTFVSGAADCLKYWQAKDGPIPDKRSLLMPWWSMTMAFWSVEGTMGRCTFGITRRGTTFNRRSPLFSQVRWMLKMLSQFDGTSTRLITGEADKTIKIWKQDDEASELTHPIELVAWRKKCVKEANQQ
jgi:pleiotropic regulator 1